MKIIVIDTIGSQAISGNLNPQGIECQNYWIPKDNDKTAFELAAEINSMCADEEVLILLNLHIRHAPTKDIYYGIELLKEIRVNDYYDYFSYLQKVHVVLFSTFSIEHLLKKQEPKFFIILSPGTTFFKLPADLELLKPLQLIEQRLQDMKAIRSYFKVSDTTVEQRHGHANWWAATRFIDHYFTFYPNERHDPTLNQFLKFRTPQARDAQFIYADLFNDEVREKKIIRLRNRIEAGREKVKTVAPGGHLRNKKIGLIDDQGKQIISGLDLGWTNLYSLLFFGEMEGIHEIDFDQPADAIVDQVDDTFDCILLDLMLGEEDRHLKVERTRGAQLLFLIKKRYPMLPVVITTASNKAETRRALRQLGCDAFWIKEAIEKRLSKEESMNRVLDLLELVIKLTGSRFNLLKSCQHILDHLPREGNWWNGYQWPATHDRPAHVTKIDNNELFEQLKQGLLLIRTFLQNQVMGEGYHTELEESFWLSGVIVRFARMIEHFHGSAEDFIGSSLLRARGDHLGAALYHMRHQAAHYFKNDPVDFDYLATFLRAFFCYLKLGPTPEFQRKSRADVSVEELMQASGRYKQLYLAF